MGVRRIDAEPAPAPKPAPSETSDDDTKIEPAPSPVRTVSREPVSDVEKIDEPETQSTKPVAESDLQQTDAETDRPGTNGQSPDCVSQETESGSHRDCQTKSLALTSPQSNTEETREAATADRSTSELIAHHATTPDAIVIETPQSVESPARSEPQKAEAAMDQLSGEGLPDGLLADALTDALADEKEEAADSKLGQGVFAAGAFAVAFSKPLSRLTGSDGLTFGDSAVPYAMPVMFARKRRKDERKSSPRTKDRPDDADDPDESDEPSRSRGPAREAAAAFDESKSANAIEYYASIEAAIHATLHSRRDSSDDSAPAGGLFHSAKSFAVGALAAATALLTIQGTRRPERSRPQLRPAAPTYHGQTAVAAS